MRLNIERLGAWLIIAPIGAAFCAAFTLSLAYWLFGFGATGHVDWKFNPSPAPLLGLTFLYGSVAAVLALAANATIGVAWQVLADRLRWRTLPAHLMAGITSGTAFGTVILWNVLVANWRVRQLTDVAPLLCFGAVVGGLTALFAWLIRRPDRDQPNPPTSMP